MRVSKKPILFSIMISLLLASFSYFFQPLMPFQSIAHRGASNYAPENTIASFKKAVDLGFDYIELDVRLSKDRQLVVIHDADVQRTTDGEGYIEDLTASEIKQLDAGVWFSPEFTGEKVPFLNEVLDRFSGKIGILIEMKTSENQQGIPEVLSEMLMSYKKDVQLINNIKVQSFEVNDVKKFQQLAPDIPAGILLNKPLDMFQLADYRHFASFLSVNHLSLSKSFITQAELFGYEIYSWTIKKQYQFIKMQRLGVQGIISDEELKIPASRFYALISPFLKGQDLLKTLLT